MDSKNFLYTPAVSGVAKGLRDRTNCLKSSTTGDWVREGSVTI